MLQSHKETFFIFLFFGFISLTLLAPLSSNIYIPNIGDFFNHLASIVQAKIALDAGQFPIRIAPLEHHGWIYPLYQFYAPTAYTVAALIYKYITPWNAFLAYKITLWFALTLGGIYIYRLAFWMTTSNTIALLSGAFYLVSPYMITVMNNWGSFTEPLCLGILPMTLYYSLRCCFVKNDFLSFLLAALAWFCMVTIHPISFVYTSLFIGLFILLLKYYQLCSWERCVWTATAYALGCLLAMWVLGPMMTIGGSLEINSTLTDPGLFNRLSPLAGLLTPKIISPQLGLDSRTVINPALGWPMVMTLILSIYLLYTQKFKEDPLSKNFMKPLFILFIFIFLLVWNPLNLWPYFPKVLRLAQYCWRLLNQSLWIGTLLFTCVLYSLYRENIEEKHVILGLLLLGIAIGSWFPALPRHPQKIEDITKDPRLSFSRYDYIISPMHLPVTLDETRLPTFITKTRTLKTDAILSLPSVILTSFPKLLLHIEGKTLPAFLTPHSKLEAFVDNRVIASYPLHAGHYEWNIPIAKLFHSHQKTFTLQFKSPGTPIVPVYDVAFTKFDPSLHILPVKKLDPHCKRTQGNQSVYCDILVPPTVNFLELPSLYYPNMLNITLNNQKTIYTPILHEDFALAGIKALPGKMNHIEITFTGLPWANDISLLAWILWGSSLFTLIFLKIKARLNAHVIATPS